jgi:hypothetical protein
MNNSFLTYFNPNGALIETVHFDTKKTSIKAIITEIKTLRDKGKLPGCKRKNVDVIIEWKDKFQMVKFKKRITVASAKGKGRRLQQWTAKKISELLDLPWGSEEQIASREMGQAGTDIRLVADAKELFPWSVECKNTESWGVPSFIKQAKENQLPGTDWLVVMTKNHHENIVVLDAEVFFDILRLMRGSKKGR